MVSADVPRVGDIQVSQDLPFQRRSWAFQRVGWALMAAVLVAGAAGFFGNGVRSDAAASGDGFQIQYPHYARHRSPEKLRLVISSGAVDGDEARVAFPVDYLDAFDVESVIPEPDAVEADHDSIIYVFKLSTQAAAATITFNLSPDDTGFVTGSVRLNDAPVVEFSQFIYP